jgi:hypothetical protein
MPAGYTPPPDETLVTTNDIAVQNCLSFLQIDPSLLPSWARLVYNIAVIIRPQIAAD